MWQLFGFIGLRAFPVVGTGISMFCRQWFLAVTIPGKISYEIGSHHFEAEKQGHRLKCNLFFDAVYKKYGWALTSRSIEWDKMLIWSQAHTMLQLLFMFLLVPLNSIKEVIWSALIDQGQHMSARFF